MAKLASFLWLWLALSAVVACTERGTAGLEYRWSSEATWHAAPGEHPRGDEDFFLRTKIPDLGPRPAMGLYQPPSLREVTVDGTPLPLGTRWAIVRLPADSGGKSLVVRYHSRYAVPNPGLTFGSEDTLAAQAVKDDLAPYGLGVAMVLLGLGAFASLIARPARAWFYFGAFAVSIGTMMVLEVQDFYVLWPIAAARDPMHEASIFGIAASFAGFIAEVFRGRLARALRILSLSSLACAALVIGLHLGGVLAARRLRFVAEAHIALGLVLALVTTIPRRGQPGSRVFMVGVLGFIATGVPDMLSGLGLLNIFAVKWGAAFFVMCMGFVLYDRYHHNEIELEKRVRDVETLNAELRHQVAARSRDLAHHLSSTGELPKLGTVIAGRYEVIRAIGAGGMGSVFEVARLSDGTRFALKVMSGQGGHDAFRFAREAEIAAKLVHPNLVSVVDVGVGPWGSPFIVMELVTGGTLADRSLDAKTVGPVLAAVARALAALHGARVIHRDLKPSNVLVSERSGELVIKVADFGVARSMVSQFDATQEASAVVTKTGAFIGTPLYMAPEQAFGAERVTPAADLYSFGVMAYELLSGAPPFATPVFFLAMSKAALPEVPRFDAFVRDARVREALRACLSPNPDERPSAQALTDLLSEVFPQAPLALAAS